MPVVAPVISTVLPVMLTKASKVRIGPSQESGNESTVAYRAAARATGAPSSRRRLDDGPLSGSSAIARPRWRQWRQWCSGSWKLGVTNILARLLFLTFNRRPTGRVFTLLTPFRTFLFCTFRSLIPYPPPLFPLLFALFPYPPPLTLLPFFVKCRFMITDTGHQTRRYSAPIVRPARQQVG